MIVDIAHVFTFEPIERKKLTFSDATKIRCETVHPFEIKLKKGATGYPTTSNLNVRGPLLNPKAVRQWIAFDVTFALPKVGQTSPTSIGWKLSNGTTDYYWNGAAWTAAGASTWSTLEQIQANIGTFPATARKIQFIVNLKTTDATVTPTVKEVRVLYKAEITSFFDEVIYRTLIQSLKTKLEPETDITFDWPGGTTYDLDSLDLEESVEIADVYGAFNYSTDSDLTTNLKSSFNTSTHVLTLTGSLAAATPVLVRVVYAPTIALSTHPSFNEVPKIPAVEVVDVKEVFSASPIAQVVFVNRNDYTAKILDAPRQVHYDLQLRAVTARAGETSALADAIMRFIYENRLLRISALDVDVALVIQSEPAMMPKLDTIHLHEMSIGLRIMSADRWILPSTAGFAVQQLNVTGDLSVTIA